MLSVFFSSKCSLFHNGNLFGSCIIHILYTECDKIKKNNSGVKGLMHKIFFHNKFIIRLYIFRALCAHHQEVKIVLSSIWYQHTCRWPSCAQVERRLSPLSTCAQHVEAYNKLIMKEDFVH